MERHKTEPHRAVSDSRGSRSPRPRTLTGRLALIAVLATALLALGATGASAVVVHLAGGKVISYEPVGGSFAPSLQLAPVAPLAKKQPPLLYHGGPVMPSNTNYAFYWDPAGAPAYAAGYESGINLFRTPCT